MEFIEKWNGNKVRVVWSKEGVIATVDYKDNLVASGVQLCPPPEITQKLFKSNQQRHFAGENGNEVARHLGYYCDLQSLHSEDAITWSIFGPLIYDSSNNRKSFVEELFGKINVPFQGSVEPRIWLWRRYPHPDTLVSGGPEIDFSIQTEETLLLGEAKWLSKEGRSQGKDKNKTQFDVRRDFITKYGQTLYPQVSNFVILGINLNGSLFERCEEECDELTLLYRNASWSDLCHFSSHPLQQELEEYLCWKLAYSRIREPAPTAEEQQKAMRNFLKIAEKIIRIPVDEANKISSEVARQFVSELEKSCLPLPLHEHKSAAKCVENRELLREANLYKVHHLLTLLYLNIRALDDDIELFLLNDMIDDVTARLSFFVDDAKYCDV